MVRAANLIGVKVPPLAGKLEPGIERLPKWRRLPNKNH